MIKDNLSALIQSIPSTVTLVAVSKTKPVASLLEAHQAGQRDFGENKVQELVDKASVLPQNIRWHMIGHLQRNKVKYIAPFVSLIHSVDSFRLLNEINKQGKKNDRVIDCLLQVRIAQEETKFGLTFENSNEILNQNNYTHIRIRGLMGMASFTDNQIQIESEFKSLAQYYKQYQDQYDWDTLSMGMSGDYPLALSCGSTMIRVGSRIFGSRN
ncbi:MAG: YggS family pyridoxal phosphate-dependent enzyme [Flavobacteriaceae bacterium]|nr:YggS family pyridoxal phosphate-dependent enzyme [Flavobacteriaceae bacterium]|tara:strand:+ start:3083 stop:3721 length:639 start_codon:yes stop_codon:yes gene_type:complete